MFVRISFHRIAMLSHSASCLILFYKFIFVWFVCFDAALLSHRFCARTFYAGFGYLYYLPDFIVVADAVDVAAVVPHGNSFISQTDFVDSFVSRSPIFLAFVCAIWFFFFRSSCARLLIISDAHNR